MNRRTYLHFAVLAAVATTGLTGCNVTDFTVTPEGQKELDKLKQKMDPAPQPDPSATVKPQPDVPVPTPIPTPTKPIPTPTMTATPMPSPVLDPVPSPTPTPVPTVRPSPVTPVPSPIPTPTATVTPPGPKVLNGSNEFNPPKVETRPMVDILSVVDNSGSMQDDQNILAQSFGAFIKSFREKDVDAHYGLITTDVTPATARSGGKNYWEDGKLNGYYSPGPGNLLSRWTNPSWLTSDDKSLQGRFTSNVQVGTKGAGSEQGLQSIEQALSDAKIGKGGFNEGFLREQAMLSVVVVSDEDNDITEKGVTPEMLIDRVRTRIAQVKGANSRGYSCDLVINSSVPAPSKTITYPLTAGSNYYPNVYHKAADKMGCRKLDIGKNWGTDLAKIGYDIANQAEKEFKLSARAIASSIIVKIDGRVIAADAANGYVYHADRTTIELMGDALASSAGAKITVDYQYTQ